jgi:hypothetical protein
MEKRSKRRLDFVESYVQHEGIVMPKMKSKMVVSNYTKRYSNNLFLLTQLSPCGRVLLDFMTENMTSENIVYTNMTARLEFISFISFVTKEVTVFSDHTVKKSLGQLTKLGFLIPVTRGSMMVNPEYFFKGNEEDRLRAIKELYESNLVVPHAEDILDLPKAVVQPLVPGTPVPNDELDVDDLLSRINNL